MELIAIWIACPFAGMLAGSAREAKMEGFLAGLILGPIGVIAMLGYDSRLQCPQCRTRHYVDAKICPGCCSPLPEKPPTTGF